MILGSLKKKTSANRGNLTKKDGSRNYTDDLLRQRGGHDDVQGHQAGVLAQGAGDFCREAAYLNMELGEIMNWPDWELVPFLSNNRGNNLEEVVKKASWV